MSIPAGEFCAWLTGMRAALAGTADSDVPCGSCTACCRSGQFVHVGPEDERALAVIPPELLFAAPGLPAGNFVMGYDQDGCCPMLVDDACTIYADRPRTCRVFDCRLFTALDRVNDDTPMIAQRIRAWEFTYADDATRAQADAIRAAGRLDPE